MLHSSAVELEREKNHQGPLGSRLVEPRENPLMFKLVKNLSILREVGDKGVDGIPHS